MTIEFQCPNGHHLKCQDELAGKIHTCPACNTRIRIPERGQATVAIEVPDEVAFLCPNGHQLHGPVTLAGRAGQCPKCHTKFQVPTLEEMLAAGDEYHGETGSTRMDAQPSDSGVDPEDLPLEYDELDEEPAAASYTASTASGDARSLRSTGARFGGTPRGMGLGGGTASTSLHPMARLVRELWPRREHGAVVELHFTGGDVIEPDLYAPHLDSPTHGVFAVRELDGTYTLTAVAWDAVARAAIRGLGELPEGMVE